MLSLNPPDYSGLLIEKVKDFAYEGNCLSLFSSVYFLMSFGL